MKECSTGFYFFEKVQDLLTRGAAAVQHFTITGSMFLTFGNNQGDVQKHKTGSVVYKMDEPSEKFTLYQTLQTRGAHGVEYFSIADKHFLAVAYHWDGTYQPDSVVFQWNGRRFVVFQKLPTKGAAHFKFFTSNREKYLTVANRQDESTYSTESVIYKWNGFKFNKFQEIATEGAMGCTAFGINNVTFIAFANYYNSQQKYSVQSTVFKWSGGHFVKLQSLQTYGAYDVKSVNMNCHTFLAFACYYSGSSYNTDSFVYKWMVPSSFFSNPFLLVEPSLGILSWSAVIPTWVWPISKAAARKKTFSQLCTRPLDHSSSSIKRFPPMELVIWHHLNTKVTLIWQ